MPKFYKNRWFLRASFKSRIYNILACLGLQLQNLSTPSHHFAVYILIGHVKSHCPEGNTGIDVGFTRVDAWLFHAAPNGDDHSKLNTPLEVSIWELKEDNVTRPQSGKKNEQKSSKIEKAQTFAYYKKRYPNCMARKFMFSHRRF